jgi:1-acyl-sn-glycerol-3-phosphate acyltransferase
MKEQVYEDDRPSETLEAYYEHSLSTPPDRGVYEVVRVVTSIVAWVVFRTRTIDSANIPTSGPLVLAPNHFSNFDHFFMGQATRRKVQFMAKSQIFRGGPLAYIYKHGGVFPVQRGRRDERSFAIVRAILSRDGTVCVYCEGGRSRTGRLAERAKPGIGRIALETGAAVVPVAISGSQDARNWKRLQFPRVRVRYGTAMRWEVVADPTREQQQAVADEIFAEIRRLYDALEPAPAPVGA